MKKKPSLAEQSSPQNLPKKHLWGIKVSTIALLSLIAACTSIDSSSPTPPENTIDVSPRSYNPTEQTTYSHVQNQSDSSAPNELLDPFNAPEINPQHTYSLPELIDLAQRINPTTRTAWLHAEQAATAAGMTRSAYLPFISAIAIAGYQKSHKSDRFSILDHELELSTRSSIRGVVPALTLEWLLFDFGKRDAIRKAAQHMAAASRFVLGATHQAVIFDVTQNYFQYVDALQQLKLNEENLNNAQYILEAAEANYQAGLGTSIEVAQAKQLKAQANLALVKSQGAVNTTKQLLMSAIGLEPNTQLVVDIKRANLPTINNLPNDATLQQAVQQRPDVQATQATLDAAKAEIESARANYYPKIALMGITAGGNSTLNIQGLPSMNPRASSTGVLLGVNIPIFDGGLRSKQLQQAQLEAQAAEQLHIKNEHNALKEMYIAGDALRTALEAVNASKELLQAAQTTYDAALESYTVGLSSMTLLSEAASGLAIAKEAHNAAYTAAQIASASLAFAMGTLNQHSH